MNKNTIFLAIAVLAIIVTGVLILAGPSLSGVLPFGNNSQAVADSALVYINANLLAPGDTATLSSVSEESGLIKLSLMVSGRPIDSYVTNDGKLLFPQAIPLVPVVADDAEPSTQITAQEVDSSKVITAGTPFIGKESAPVVLAFWSDYQCPFCKKAVEESLAPLIKEYVDTGKIKIVFKDYAFLGADSTTLAKFGRAVWEASPSKFGTWHEAIYKNQGQENSGWATETKMMEITTNAIGSADAQKALALFKKNGAIYQQKIDADKAEGESFGVKGTPGAIVGKQFISGADTYANFKSAVDQALADAGK